MNWESRDRTVFGCDIGCSLLSWDFFAVDSTQTHHGRTTPVMTGIKRGNPDLICVGYMGDGGAYSIGSQHTVNAAARNERITMIVVNNTNYGMTGGQMSPDHASRAEDGDLALRERRGTDRLSYQRAGDGGGDRS